jgi:lipid A 3-O-deacylase
MRLSLLAALSLSTFALASAAEAQGRPEHLVLKAGMFDALDDEQSSANFGIEYRSRYIANQVRPVVGYDMNTDGGSYVYGGLNYDLSLISGLTLTPGIAAGKYTQRDSKNLGGDIMFRPSAELSYVMDNKSRVGVVYEHLSNFGLEDHNPGADTISVNYAHAVSILGPN